jgi:hypothetical protein
MCNSHVRRSGIPREERLTHLVTWEKREAGDEAMLLCGIFSRVCRGYHQDQCVTSVLEVQSQGRILLPGYLRTVM